MKKDLLIRINEVLYYLWDPVGISDIPEARNEGIAHIIMNWVEYYESFK